MTSRSQKPKFKLNSRAIRALGLLEVLQNYKKNQRLYEAPKMKRHKTYKDLFETIKKKSKKKFYSGKLQKFEGGARKTWSVRKEILGKCTAKSSTLPTKITCQQN